MKQRSIASRQTLLAESANKRKACTFLTDLLVTWWGSMLHTVHTTLIRMGVESPNQNFWILTRYLSRMRLMVVIPVWGWWIASRQDFTDWKCDKRKACVFLTHLLVRDRRLFDNANCLQSVFGVWVHAAHVSDNLDQNGSRVSKSKFLNLHEEFEQNEADGGYPSMRLMPYW